MPIRTAPALPVSKSQRAELQRMAASSSLPHRQVVQAKALLWAAEGVANQEIARRCEVDSDAVRRWRAKFADKGVGGVGVIAKGRGRKSALPEGMVAEIVRVTCQEGPADTSTHWSTRSLAKRFGVGKDTIAKVWSDHNLKPWKVETFKISNDPHFEEKLCGRWESRETRWNLLEGHDLEVVGSSARRRAWEAALIPAASPPTTTRRSTMPANLSRQRRVRSDDPASS